MATNKCRDLLRQAHSSRMKHAYSALVEIRKKFMKTPKDVAVLANNGLVKRLLDLIRSRESLEDSYRSNIIDISLSILSNMCMEDITRKKVLKDKGTGVTIIVELFEELEAERLENRACRCLSNLLLDPGSWELVCTSSIIEKVVKLLRDTEKEEYRLTYIRALRLIGQTGSHVHKLVEKNAVSVVMKFVDCDTEPVKQSSLRCIHSLSSHGSTLQFASQVTASGKLSCLLTLVKEFDTETFQLVIRLCEFHNFRAEFGNMGGIVMFKDMFLSSDSFCERAKEEILSVLCLCCKEAVNRIKLRDENILILFIQALSNSELSNLHTRIVSALVCFLYDEASFEVLLENGLVPLLMIILSSHLAKETDESAVEDGVERKEVSVAKVNSGALVESSASFQQKHSDGTDMLEKESNQTETADVVSTEEKTESGRSGNGMKLIENSTETVMDHTEELVERNQETSGTQIFKHIGKLEEKVKPVEVKARRGVQSDNSEDDFEEDVNREIENNRKSRPVYSIDSPTYEPNIVCEYEDYGGAKCIERFTPPHSVDYSHQKNYSPLSNISYFSQVESSPEYSPFSSPSTSPVPEGTSCNIFPGASPDCHGYSPETGSHSVESFPRKNPKYTGVDCGHYSPLSSPDPEKTRPDSPYLNSFSSPEGPVGHISNLNASQGFDPTSPCECDELSEDPFAIGKEKHITANTTTENIKDEKSVPQPIAERIHLVENKNTDSVQDIHEHSNKDGKSNIEKNLDDKAHEYVVETLTRLKESLKLDDNERSKRKRICSRNNVTDYNILILLSRVSQMNDPSKRLVSREVLHCLLDYMSLTEGALARCPRLLSRVFRNPVCFNQVLTLCLPTMIFDKLLKYADLKSLTKDLKNNQRKIKRKLTYGNAEICHEIETDSDRFSMSDESLLEEEQASKRRRTSEDNPKQSHSFKGQYHNLEENICDTGRSAMAFLEDLSGVVDSNYGRGVVNRLLHTVARDQLTELCINVLYITWTEASRQYFFNEREVLDEVLRVLHPSDHFDSEQFVRTVNGIRLLSHILDTKNKYQTLKSKNLFSKWTDRSASSGATVVSKSPRECKSTNFKQTLVKSAEFNEKDDSKRNLRSPITQDQICCMKDDSVATDIVFVVMDEKIPANRAKLAERSEIFAAMLEGHYSEAKRSVINIPESSKWAFEFLIHHLHGCQHGVCLCIDQLYEQVVNRHTAEQCIQLLEESNKYMLTELYDMVIECLFSRYIIPESAFSVLKYAVVHRNDSLLKAAVSCLFQDSKTMEEIVEHLCEILSSCYTEIFIATLREMLVE